MYESYVWPSAASYKRDRSIIVKWLKELFEELAKKVDEKDRQIP